MMVSSLSIYVSLGLNELTPAWINNYDATVDVWERMSNFSHFTWHYIACDYLSMLGLMFIYVSKRGPR